MENKQPRTTVFLNPSYDRDHLSQAGGEEASWLQFYQTDWWYSSKTEKELKNLVLVSIPIINAM